MQRPKKTEPAAPKTEDNSTTILEEDSEHSKGCLFICIAFTFSRA